MPEGIGYKEFSPSGKSVRVKGKSFKFSEFRKHKKQEKLNRMAQSVIASMRSDAKAEARKKNRATAERAIEK